MEITFIRHGTTLWNEQARYQGWSDIALSSVGMAEAHVLRARLRLRSFDAIVSSDLSRCQETATIVFPYATVEVSRAFREISFGVWEGLTYAECMALPSNDYTRWIDDPETVTPHGGESLCEFERRIYTATNTLIDHHSRDSNRRIAVVTHGGPIRALLRRVLGSSPSAAYATKIPPCGVVRIEMTPHGDTILPLEDECPNTIS